MPELLGFYDWQLEVEPNITRPIVAAAPALDPHCCNACATWLAAVTQKQVPPEMLQLLDAVGADPAKPVEVWGAPDGGFLNGWYVFAGKITSGAWNGGPDGAFVEIRPGFTCWLSSSPSMQPDPAYGATPVVQFEFVWQSDTLKPLAAEAWRLTTG